MRSHGLLVGMPTSRHNRHLEDGVVAGIAAYGNAFGVPILAAKPFTISVMKEISSSTHSPLVCVKPTICGLLQPVV